MLFISGHRILVRSKKVPNSLEDIKEIVDYAHKFYVKVHVTVNTILTDDEILKAK